MTCSIRDDLDAVLAEVRRDLVWLGHLNTRGMWVCSIGGVVAIWGLLEWLLYGEGLWLQALALMLLAVAKWCRSYYDREKARIRRKHPAFHAYLDRVVEAKLAEPKLKA